MTIQNEMLTVGDFRFGVIDFICAVAAWAYESVRSWARRDGGLS